jgi:hypothetical protein
MEMSERVSTQDLENWSNPGFRDILDKGVVIDTLIGEVRLLREIIQEAQDFALSGKHNVGGRLYSILCRAIETPGENE